MIDLTLNLCFGGLVLAILLALYRLARGPTVLDRILAFDLIAISAVGMIVLLSIQWHTPVYVELILIFSLLGFFSTLAFVFYLHKTNDIEAGESAAARPETTENPPAP